MGVGSERPRDPQHSQQSSVKKTPIKSIKMGDKEANLRGQVINKPKEQMWMLKSESDLEEYKYTCEPGHMEWTPLNSNLTMQGIKVQVNRNSNNHNHHHNNNDNDNRQQKTERSNSNSSNN